MSSNVLDEVAEGVAELRHIPFLINRDRSDLMFALIHSTTQSALRIATSRRNSYLHDTQSCTFLDPVTTALKVFRTLYLASGLRFSAMMPSVLPVNKPRLAADKQPRQHR